MDNNYNPWKKIHLHPYTTYKPRFDPVERKPRFASAAVKPYDGNAVLYNSDWNPIFNGGIYNSTEAVNCMCGRESQSAGN
jgi:hypothetical protein